MQTNTSSLAIVNRHWPRPRLTYVTRFPGRIHERPFWMIQSLMLAITALHYLMEQAWLSDTANVHHIPVTLYLIAVVYAGLYYGFEGGVLTAVEAVLLSLPSILLQHREGYAWMADTAALIATMGTGVVVAWLVEQEAGQRRLAEATSHRLALLNEVGSAVTQTLELEGVLRDAVRGVARALEVDRAWIAVWDSPSSPPRIRAQIGEPISIVGTDGVERSAWEIASREVQVHEKAARVEHVAVAVPLVAEGRILGALGTACRAARPCTSDDIELLSAMANQIAIAIENARLYRDERQMRQALRDYASQVTHAQEEERKRIARELHDDVVQSLILISRELGELQEVSQSGSPSDPSRLAAIRAGVRGSAQAVRRFSRDLRPSVLDDLGLVPAIDWLVNDLSQRTGIAATLDVTGEACRLPTQMELHLFRITQESLRNVERHAEATEVRVTLDYGPRDVRLAVRDNGRGLPASPASNGGLGLLGMKERARLLGGTLIVDSAPGRGVVVSSAIPLPLV